MTEQPALFEDHTVPCPTCGGHGSVRACDDWESCKTCRGTGRVSDLFARSLRGLESD